MPCANTFSLKHLCSQSLCMEEMKAVANFLQMTEPRKQDTNQKSKRIIV